eukprot:scaffold2640_cov376-Prasinococcus_capsulatus_cf.AAC.12
MHGSRSSMLGSTEREGGQANRTRDSQASGGAGASVRYSGQEGGHPGSRNEAASHGGHHPTLATKSRPSIAQQHTPSKSSPGPNKYPGKENDQSFTRQAMVGASFKRRGWETGNSQADNALAAMAGDDGSSSS